MSDVRCNACKPAHWTNCYGHTTNTVSAAISRHLESTAVCACHHSTDVCESAYSCITHIPSDYRLQTYVSETAACLDQLQMTHSLSCEHRHTLATQTLHQLVHYHRYYTLHYTPSHIGYTDILHQLVHYTHVLYIILP